VPVELDATVGGANANSNVSLEWAEAYFATRLDATIWHGLIGDAGTERKKLALIAGTNALELLPIDGAPTTLTQRLAMPRTGLLDRHGRVVPYDVIPEDWKAATCEEALARLQLGADPSTPNPLAQFSAIKVPGVSLQLRADLPRTNDTMRAVVWRLASTFCRDAGETRIERG
jgi:hypothetical protein